MKNPEDINKSEEFNKESDEESEYEYVDEDDVVMVSPEQL
ncbi:hypothetical protein Tco_1341110, partial [Tanacetum coccineum]